MAHGRGGGVRRVARRDGHRRGGSAPRGRGPPDQGAPGQARRAGAGPPVEGHRARWPPRGARGVQEDRELGALYIPLRPLRPREVHRGQREPEQEPPDGDREAEGARGGDRPHQEGLHRGDQIREGAAAEVRGRARRQEAARGGVRGPEAARDPAPEEPGGRHRAEGAGGEEPPREAPGVPGAQEPGARPRGEGGGPPGEGSGGPGGGPPRGRGGPRGRRGAAGAVHRGDPGEGAGVPEEGGRAEEADHPPRRGREQVQDRGPAPHGVRPAERETEGRGRRRLREEGAGAPDEGAIDPPPGVRDPAAEGRAPREGGRDEAAEGAPRLQGGGAPPAGGGPRVPGAASPGGADEGRARESARRGHGGARAKGAPGAAEGGDRPERGGGPGEGEVPEVEDGGAAPPRAGADRGGERGPRGGTAARGEAGEGEDGDAPSRRPPPRRDPVRHERDRVWPRPRREGGDRGRVHGGGAPEGGPDHLGPHGQDGRGRPAGDGVRPPWVRGIREARPREVRRRVQQVDGRGHERPEHDVRERPHGLRGDREGGGRSLDGVQEEARVLPARVPFRLDADRVPRPDDDVQVPPAVRGPPEAGQGRRPVRDREGDARGEGDRDALLDDGRHLRVQGRAAPVLHGGAGRVRRPVPRVHQVHPQPERREHRFVLAGNDQVGGGREAGGAVLLSWAKRSLLESSPGPYATSIPECFDGGGGAGTPTWGIGIGGGSRRSRAITTASGMHTVMIVVWTSFATSFGICPLALHWRATSRPFPSYTRDPSIRITPTTSSTAR